MFRYQAPPTIDPKTPIPMKDGICLSRISGRPVATKCGVPAWQAKENV